jgi:hypothetical protein
MVDIVNDSSTRGTARDLKEKKQCLANYYEHEPSAPHELKCVDQPLRFGRLSVRENLGS